MRKKLTVLCLLLISIFSFSFFTSNKVNAIKYREDKVRYQNKEIGKVKIYEDFVVKIDYTYKLKNVEIELIDIDNPMVDNQIYKSNEDYFKEHSVTFYLKNIFNNFVIDTNYKIIVSASFATSDNAGSIYQGHLTEYDMKYIEESKDDESSSDRDKEYEDRILTGVDKFKKILVFYVIPIVYAVLFIAIIIKSILLSMDLVKYADLPEVREQKIKSYVYVAVGILLLFAINTTAGFFVGLFG